MLKLEINFQNEKFPCVSILSGNQGGPQTQSEILRFMAQPGPWKAANSSWWDHKFPGLRFCETCIPLPRAGRGARRSTTAAPAQRGLARTCLSMAFGISTCVRQEAKADSTLRSSQAVPHPSTDRALRRLTSEVERDPVHSTWYGRQRT